jgi:hypothetical protein
MIELMLFLGFLLPLPCFLYLLCAQVEAARAYGCAGAEEHDRSSGLSGDAMRI